MLPSAVLGEQLAKINFSGTRQITHNTTWKGNIYTRERTREKICFDYESVFKCQLYMNFSKY